MKVIILSLLFALMLSCSSTGKKSEMVTSVYVNEDENAVLIDTPEKRGSVLFRDRGSVFQVIATTGDNQWALVIQMPSEIGERAETVYLLFNTYLKKKVHPGLYHHETLLEFEETDEGSFLITGDERRISLKAIYQEISGVNK